MERYEIKEKWAKKQIVVLDVDMPLFKLVESSLNKIVLKAPESLYEAMRQCLVDHMFCMWLSCDSTLTIESDSPVHIFRLTRTAAGINLKLIHEHREIAGYEAVRLNGFGSPMPVAQDEVLTLKEVGDRMRRGE